MRRDDRLRLLRDTTLVQVTKAIQSSFAINVAKDKSELDAILSGVFIACLRVGIMCHVAAGSDEKFLLDCVRRIYRQEKADYENLEVTAKEGN